MYMQSKGLDPNKHTLHFEIKDEEKTLGELMPVIDQGTIHRLIEEIGSPLDNILSESIGFAGLIPSMTLSIESSSLPERTKDKALDKLDKISSLGASLIDHALTLIILTRELNALINTSAAIENERIKRAGGDNNMRSDAQHDGDV